MPWAPWSSQRAGGRHGALGLRARHPSPPLVGDCSKRCPPRRALKAVHVLGIKASSPCGQNSEHIEDILKPEKLILSMEQRSTLTSLRPSPRHAATMLLTGAAFPVHALALDFSWYMPIDVLRQKREKACAPCHAMTPHFGSWVTRGLHDDLEDAQKAPLNFHWTLDARGKGTPCAWKGLH